MQVEPNDPTLADAMNHLAALEAEDHPPATEPKPEDSVIEPKPDSATDGERAPEASTEPVQSPKPDSKDGASAAPEKAPEVKAQDNQSKFAKDQDRRIRSWKEINEAKTERSKADEALKNREAEIVRREREIEQRREQVSKPKYSPEQYEDFAKLSEEDAEKLEARGEYDAADDKRKLAKQARDAAEHYRKNPPAVAPTEAQAEADYQRLQKEWWGKAAIDFPAVAKQGSPEAEALKALVKAEPAVLNDPKGMYYAARLVVAETVATRVPTLEKELGELRAKVKDYEQKLAIDGNGAAAGGTGEIPFSQKNEDEQLADLTRQAQQIDARGF